MRHADVSLQQILSLSVKVFEKYLAIAIVFSSNHALGEVTLQSINPVDLSTINLNFLSRLFDKRLAIESVRETLEFLNKPLMSKDSIRFAAGPEGDGDEDILVREIVEE